MQFTKQYLNIYGSDLRTFTELVEPHFESSRVVDTLIEIKEVMKLVMSLHLESIGYGVQSNEIAKR